MSVANLGITYTLGWRMVKYPKISLNFSDYFSNRWLEK